MLLSENNVNYLSTSIVQSLPDSICSIIPDSVWNNAAASVALGRVLIYAVLFEAPAFATKDSAEERFVCFLSPDFLAISVAISF